MNHFCDTEIDDLDDIRQVVNELGRRLNAMEAILHHHHTILYDDQERLSQDQGYATEIHTIMNDRDQCKSS